MNKDWDLVNDNNLLSNILYSIEKRAQDQSVLNTARKLVRSLNKQMSGQLPVPNIQITPKDINSPNIDLKADNINNLDNLLKYLWDNKVTLDGQQIAYKANEVTQEMMDKTQFASMTGKTVREVDQRAPSTNPGQVGAAPSRLWETSEYYVNLPILVKYLQYLQQKGNDLKREPSNTGQNATGQVLSVYVGKLIDDLNRRAQTNLSRTQKSEPGQPTDLPDDEPLDSFSSKSFDTKGNSKGSQNDKIRLYAGNLKSRESLNAWLQGSNDLDKLGSSGEEAQVIISDGYNKQKSISYKENPCIVMRALYLRAKNIAAFSSNVQQSKAAQYYFKKIQEIGPTFNGPDDKPCNVTLAIQVADSTMPKVNPELDNAHQKGEISPDQLINLANLQVFNRDDIDFAKIEQFMKAYYTMAGNRQNVSTNIQHVRSSMHGATNNSMNMSLTNFPMRNISYQSMKLSTRAPARDFISRLLNELLGVIEFSGQVYRDFINVYGDRIKAINSGAYNNMLQQISGEWQSNRSNLLDLQQAVRAALTRGE